MAETEDKFAVKSQNWDNPVKVAMTEKFVRRAEAVHHFRSDDRVVEFGCGTGLVGLAIAHKTGAITMIDNSPSMLQKLREKIAHLPFGNISIVEGELRDCKCPQADCIIGFMTLHHIENTQELLQTAYSILASGGTLIIGDLTSEDGSFHGSEAVPHNGFDAEKLTLQIKGASLKNVSHEIYDRVERRSKSYPIFIAWGTK